MKITHAFGTLTLATLLVLSPALASANEGVKVGAKLKAEARVEQRDNEKKDEAVNRGDRACLKAFGHLIARGFIKNKGEVEADWSACALPFGIAKKMHRATSTASTTVDVTAPIISAIRTFVASTSARILWYTNERASSSVAYKPANATTSASVASSMSADSRLHTAVLNGLSASTTYSFTISAQDKSGNSTTSAAASFTTK